MKPPKSASPDMKSGPLDCLSGNGGAALPSLDWSESLRALVS